MVVDHLATLVDLSIRVQCRAGREAHRKMNIDARALCEPGNRSVIERVLQEAPRPDWNVSAHAHAAIVTKYLQNSLQAEFPLQKCRPLHPYLSQTGWDLQREVAWLRRKCAQVKIFVRRQTLWAVFAGWRGLQGSQMHEHSAWLRDAQVAEALYGFRLGFVAKALKVRCRSDRAAYLAQLADEVQSNPSQAFPVV